MLAPVSAFPSFGPLYSPYLVFKHGWGRRFASMYMVFGLTETRVFCRYWWTHHFSSAKTRNYLCFLVGYSNSLGLIGGLCSVEYGFATLFCAE